MNIMITGEEYNEYEARKDKIKELEARNEFLKVQYDKLNSLHQETLSEKAALKDENDAQKNEIKDLKVKIKYLEDINESLYKDYQQELSIKAALIKERDRLTNVVHKQGSDIVGLRVKLDEAENKDIRFKELVTENYRLQSSINDLKENNKALKKENEKLINRLHDYESQIAELTEKATNPDYVKFLETAKKFQESNVGILTELEEATQPERNVTIIENLYLTNNYFSEEEEDDE